MAPKKVPLTKLQSSLKSVTNVGRGGGLKVAQANLRVDAEGDVPMDAVVDDSDGVSQKATASGKKRGRKAKDTGGGDGPPKKKQTRRRKGHTEAEFSFGEGSVKKPSKAQEAAYKKKAACRAKYVEALKADATEHRQRAAELESKKRFYMAW